eukprot:SAG11_NODE_13531_length_651_cov_0.746377_2_plen_52_part_01
MRATMPLTFHALAAAAAAASWWYTIGGALQLARQPPQRLHIILFSRAARVIS